jgi:hypothetical protein
LLGLKGSVVHAWRMMSQRGNASLLRQQLVRAEERRDQHLKVLVGLRRELVRGSFVLAGRRCGKPTCRCTTGELHPTRLLSISEEGRTRMQYVPAGDEMFVREAAERYRQFRQARAELAKLSAQVLSLADALQECLTVPYPATKERKRPTTKGAKPDVPASKKDASREVGNAGGEGGGKKRRGSAVDGGAGEGGGGAV